MRFGCYFHFHSFSIFEMNSLRKQTCNMLIQNSNIAWFIIRTANKTRGKYVIYHCKLNKGSLYTRLLVDKLKKKNVSNQTFYHGKNSISTIKNGNLYSQLIQQ